MNDSIIIALREFFSQLSDYDLKEFGLMRINNDVSNNTDNFERYIVKILKTLGIPAHLYGYSYIKYAMSLICEDNSYLSVTKKLYPAIAEKFNTSKSRADRAIRTAISYIDLENSELSKELFGNSLHDNRILTNSQFFASMEDYIKLNYISK